MIVWGPRISLGDQLVLSDVLPAGTPGRAFFDQTPLLNPGETYQLQFECNFPDVSPQDNISIFVFTTLDAVLWDTQPSASRAFSNQTDPNIAPVFVTNVFQFRVEAVKTGGTTETILVDGFFRRNNIALT